MITSIVTVEMRLETTDALVGLDPIMIRHRLRHHCRNHLRIQQWHQVCLTFSLSSASLSRDGARLLKALLSTCCRCCHYGRLQQRSRQSDSFVVLLVKLKL